MTTPTPITIPTIIPPLLLEGSADPDELEVSLGRIEDVELVAEAFPELPPEVTTEDLTVALVVVGLDV